MGLGKVLAEIALEPVERILVAVFLQVCLERRPLRLERRRHLGCAKEDVCFLFFFWGGGGPLVAGGFGVGLAFVRTPTGKPAYR